MQELIIKFIDDINDHEYEVVQFHGALDSVSVPVAQREFRSHMDKLARPYVIFDLSDCPFINSNGIGFLMEIHMKFTKEHQQILIAGAPKQIQDILDLVGVPKIIPVLDTIAAAIRYIKKD